MAVTTPELLAASDSEIDDAVQFLDPMALRGVLYQLTGDEELAKIEVERVLTSLTDIYSIKEQADIDCLRAKAAALLKSYRDSGPGEIPIGPPERLRTSMSLTAGEEVPTEEFDLWLEQMALDPYARGLVWTDLKVAERAETFSVVVIGAGMGGLNAAVQLSHAGIPFTVLEKNPEVGGTWFENRYPGARVDTASRTYTHIFGVDFPYPSRFCEQAENEKYVNWVADYFDIRKNIEFYTEVRSVTWDEEVKLWEVVADSPDGSRTWRVNAVISAVGFLNRPNIPDIPGLKRFQRPWFHAARWPTGLEYAGKRVAVVGSGCTGYQLVPELVKEAEHVYLLQRNPSWAYDTPGYLSPNPPEVNWLDRNFPYLTNFIRFQMGWFRAHGRVAEPDEIDPDFQDPYAISALNKQVRDQRIAFIQSKFGDRPDLMEKMVPSNPPYSSRNVIIDPKYSIYDALLLDNATLVTEGIREVLEDRIVFQDGSECEVDIIVLATGFRATEYLWPMEIRGRGGRELNDLWAKDGARAYLGAMVPGFPNFFMLYGPNTNHNFSFAAIHLQELVTRFALECFEGLLSEGKDAVDVTEDAYWRFNSELDRLQAHKAYLYPGVKTYYNNDYGRSPTNGVFDARLMWNWLRRPYRTGNEEWSYTLGERFADTSKVIDPFFEQDLTIE